MISADFGGGDQRIVARLGSLISPVLDAMVNAMDAQMISLEGYIRANKLEGNPLQHRSGRLQSSVNYVPATIVDDTTVEGSVNGGGGLRYCARRRWNIPDTGVYAALRTQC